MAIRFKFSYRFLIMLNTLFLMVQLSSLHYALKMNRSLKELEATLNEINHSMEETVQIMDEIIDE